MKVIIDAQKTIKATKDDDCDYDDKIEVEVIYEATNKIVITTDNGIILKFDYYDLKRAIRSVMV